MGYKVILSSVAETGVKQLFLVPMRRVGMPLHRAAVRDAASLYCIPTQARGNERRLL